ncbi:M48 family metalloprotease, partial [Candidatus Gracilibacteria bacterium]|nr:M48 family metalloprotease [Candidatus Gracilibacteria bacterium]
KYAETRADQHGIDFVYDMNGQIGCALEFLESHNSLGSNISEIFSTHPITHFRIERIKEYIDEKGYEMGVCEK